MKQTTKLRKIHRSTYGPLYRPHIVERDSECFYCGDPKESVDHVPAIAVVAGIRPDILRSLGVPLVTVPACMDCNRRLADKRLGTTLERTGYLYRTLTTAYERKMAMWTEEELQEMSDMFRKMIAGKKVVAQLLLGRIRRLESRLLDVTSHPRTPSERELDAL